MSMHSQTCDLYQSLAVNGAGSRASPRCRNMERRPKITLQHAHCHSYLSMFRFIRGAVHTVV